MASRPDRQTAKQVYLPTAEQIAGGCAEPRSLWSARGRVKQFGGRASTGQADPVPSRLNRRKDPDVVSGRHG